MPARQARAVSPTRAARPPSSSFSALPREGDQAIDARGVHRDRREDFGAQRTGAPATRRRPGRYPRPKHRWRRGHPRSSRLPATACSTSYGMAAARAAAMARQSNADRIATDPLKAQHAAVLSGPDNGVELAVPRNVIAILTAVKRTSSPG